MKGVSSSLARKMRDRGMIPLENLQGIYEVDAIAERARNSGYEYLTVFEMDTNHVFRQIEAFEYEFDDWTCRRLWTGSCVTVLAFKRATDAVYVKMMVEK